MPHSVSPYTIRCFNPEKAPNSEDRYFKLGKIKGYDLFSLIQEYIELKSGKFNHLTDDDRVFNFDSVVYDKQQREIYGWLNSGTFGIKSDIINVDTSALEFNKKPKNAEIIRHFIHLKIPKEFDEGIALFHSYRGSKIKTLFHENFKEFFKERTGGLILQINQLSYEKGMDQWRDARARELKLVRFEGVDDIADQIQLLGHKEEIRIFRSGKDSLFGTLKDYFDKDSEQSKVVEVLSESCSRVKVTVDLNGRKRTFNVGSHSDNAVCEIPLGEEVVITDGNPELESMKEWCQTVVSEFEDNIYPGN